MELEITAAQLLLAELDGTEALVVQALLKDMSEEQVEQFARMYHNRRKDPVTILLATLLGFVGIGGVQRFMLGQTGRGVLYICTLGLWGIGTIIDLINHKKLTAEYNTKVAQQLAMLVKSSGGSSLGVIIE